MFHALPAWLRAGFIVGGMLFNTLFWAVPLFLMTGVKLLTPSRTGRAAITGTLARIAQNWIAVNDRLIEWSHPIDWQITGLDGLDPQRWYLIVSNHISGLDILVHQKTFHRRIPFIRFFLKRELIFVPILGAAWWALDYPFMRRNSRRPAGQRPASKNTDHKSAERAIHRTAATPGSYLVFAEGTRFTQAKHDAQNSPFRNLLQPKSGAIAYALDALGERFSALLDVTLYYPDGIVSLWDMFAGKVHRIVVHVEQRAIPEHLLNGDYQNDPVYRETLKAWILAMWQEKDDLLDQIRAANPLPLPAPADS